MQLRIYRDAGESFKNREDFDRFPCIEGLYYQASNYSVDLLFQEIINSDFGKIIIDKIINDEFIERGLSNIIILEVPDFSVDEIFYYQLKYEESFNKSLIIDIEEMFKRTVL